MEPKMKEYIFGERNGIHIIDLQKTLKMFANRAAWSANSPPKAETYYSWAPTAGPGSGRREAKRCGAFFVNHRWLGER